MFQLRHLNRRRLNILSRHGVIVKHLFLLVVKPLARCIKFLKNIFNHAVLRMQPRLTVVLPSALKRQVSFVVTPSYTVVEISPVALMHCMQKTCLRMLPFHNPFRRRCFCRRAVETHGVSIKIRETGHVAYLAVHHKHIHQHSVIYFCLHNTVLICLPLQFKFLSSADNNLFAWIRTYAQLLTFVAVSLSEHNCLVQPMHTFAHKHHHFSRLLSGFLQSLLERKERFPFCSGIGVLSINRNIIFRLGIHHTRSCKQAQRQKNLLHIISLYSRSIHIPHLIHPRLCIGICCARCGRQYCHHTIYAAIQFHPIYTFLHNAKI